MQKVRILIVEDEMLIAESLRAMLQDMGYEVAGMYRSGKDVLAAYKPGIADIVLMDIQLADGTDGIETSKQLAKVSQVPVIFITQLRDEQTRRKAIFETNAINYLNKPFTRDDVATAIDLALKHLKKDNTLIEKGEEEKLFLLNDAIFIKEDFSYKKIRIADILFLRAEGSYCGVICHNKEYLFSENLGFFENKLSFAAELLRIHRSYIININHVDKLQEGRVWINNYEIPVGKTYRNILFDRLRFI